MRKYLLMFVCAGLLSALEVECRAQDWNEVQKDPKAYMWAEGTADTVEDADRQALEHLVSMIGVSVSSIPMVFRFGSRTFVENVVLSFDGELKVSSLAFSLDRQSAQDIWDKTMWPEDTRIRIIEFMEDFRTAYALKRLDYIRDVFDDDAVIIVGKISSKAPVKGEWVTLPQLPSIRRERYSKDQYIRNLERCFAANEYINVRFSRNDVQKAGVDGEVYGIQIQQDWSSSTYGDRGYLFLVLDMNDADTTRIHVRTWQPHPDPVDGLFDLSKF